MAINLTQAQLSAALDAAANRYSGQKVAYNGAFVGECLSLCKQIYTDITSLQMPGAVNNYFWSDSYWLYFDQSPPLPALFIKTPYVSGIHYPKGSLVFYAATHHIAIWWADNGNGTHTVFEQNADPDGSPAHFSTRANSKVTGIFIPRTIDIGGKGGAVVIPQKELDVIDDTITKGMYLLIDRDLDSEKTGQSTYDYWRGRKVVELEAALYKENELARYKANNYDKLLSDLNAAKNNPVEIQKIVERCTVDLNTLTPDKASWLVQFVAWLTKTKP